MDWYGAPDEAQGKVTVSVWHDLVQESQDKTTSELPANNDTAPGTVTVTWQAKQLGSAQLVEFTQQVCQTIAHFTSGC